MATGLFGPANASARETPTLWMPMIRVSLSDTIHNETQHIVDDDVLALIDTGSDLCRIDEEMANKYSFKTIGITQTVTPTGRGIFKVYLVQMILDGHSLLLYCPAVPLRRYEGAIYDMLLGMDVIRYFDLTVSREQSLVTLSWIQS
jgi:hypothetical protein